MWLIRDTLECVDEIELWIVMESERSDFKTVTDNSRGTKSEKRDGGENGKCKKEIVFGTDAGAISKMVAEAVEKPVFGDRTLITSVEC